MKFSLLCVALTVLATLPLAAAAQNAEPPKPPILATLKPSHPRLLASASSWERLKTRRHLDAGLDAFLQRGEREARAILDVPPMAYHKQGRRLLDVSRAVLRRVLLLSMQFRLTGDRALLQRAKEEMLNAAAFADWNPSHFLDTAEMTAAIAIGYDWLFDELDETARKTISTAIIEKGLRQGAGKHDWLTMTNNWNSVCLAGMSLGALAVAEENPPLAAEILENTRAFNHNGLQPYQPAGMYPEGAAYWGYGTTFQVILLDALDSALGTDWNLSQSPGFMQTADAILQMQGPSGAFFNFSDGIERPSLEGGDFWFAHRLGHPELVRFEQGYLKEYTFEKRPLQPLSGRDRTLPLIALWWPATFDAAPTAPLSWYGKSVNPIASFRSSWTNHDAMFLSLKGGRANLSHGHMDAGSFVFEADGVRWARDLGMQPYNALESRGIDLWNSKQDSERWTVFRLNNFSHNTLTINNQLHRVEGQAAITHFSDDAKAAGAIVDLSPVFSGQATRVTRGFAFRDGEHVLLRDEIEGVKAGEIVRFNFLTAAQITINENGTQAILTEDGKRLRVVLQAKQNARFEVVSAAPPNDYDEANPNRQFLIINFLAPPTGTLSYAVFLQPFSTPRAWPEDELAVLPLKEWPFAPTQK